ncbi:MAG: SRPBCC family protein [Halobacteriales archaeon]|nr:SRPBCC family protein [Halobacteriales archaeon]
MTARVERAFEVDGDVEAVWEYIADPGNRAEAISVVDRWETVGDETTWHLELPIPLVGGTVAVRTRDVAVEPPDRVKFTGRSSVMHVTGEHRLEATEGGTRVVNEFAVDGRLPGVEGFFKRNLDGELDNLQRALEDHLAAAE